MIQLIFDYTTLRLIWWVLLGVLLIGFAVDRWLRHGRRRAAALRGEERHREARRHQHRRPGMGRQPGLVHSGRRRDLRRLAGAVCAELFRLLPRDVPGAVRADPASGRLQVSFEARERRVAPELGLGAVRRRCGSGTDLRGRGRQRAARACPSISRTICGRSTKARCSACSIRWRCIADWCRSPCWSRMVRPGSASRRKARWRNAPRRSDRKRR